MLWVCSPSHAGLETLFWVVYEMDHGVTPVSQCQIFKSEQKDKVNQDKTSSLNVAEKVTLIIND